MDLTVENVQAIFLDSLAPAGGGLTIRVSGVFNEFVFDMARLESHASEIRGFLSHLSTRYYADRGGGHSYAAMGHRRDGEHWGGRPDVERLVTLGLGLGLVDFCLDRSRWHLFPTNIPFVRLSGDLFRLCATFCRPTRGAREEGSSVSFSFDPEAHPAPPGVADEDWYCPRTFEVQDLGNVPTHVATSFYNRSVVDGFFDNSLPSWILDSDTTLHVY
jgi:hypothetical protein